MLIELSYASITMIVIVLDLTYLFFTTIVSPCVNKLERLGEKVRETQLKPKKKSVGEGGEREWQREIKVAKYLERD